MVDRDNFHHVCLNAIHETVVPVEDFTKGFLANHWYDATRVRKQLEPTNRRNELLSQEAGVSLGNLEPHRP